MDSLSQSYFHSWKRNRDVIYKCSTCCRRPFNFNSITFRLPLILLPSSVSRTRLNIWNDVKAFLPPQPHRNISHLESAPRTWVWTDFASTRHPLSHFFSSYLIYVRILIQSSCMIAQQKQEKHLRRKRYRSRASRKVKWRQNVGDNKRDWSQLQLACECTDRIKGLVKD